MKRGFGVSLDESIYEFLQTNPEFRKRLNEIVEDVCLSEISGIKALEKQALKVLDRYVELKNMISLIHLEETRKKQLEEINKQYEKDKLKLLPNSKLIAEILSNEIEKYIKVMELVILKDKLMNDERKLYIKNFLKGLDNDELVEKIEKLVDSQVLNQLWDLKIIER